MTKMGQKKMLKRKGGILTQTKYVTDSCLYTASWKCCNISLYYSLCYGQVLWVSSAKERSYTWLMESMALGQWAPCTLYHKESCDKSMSLKKM